MSGMQRICLDTRFVETDSPVVLPHGTFVGLGIFLEDGGSVDITVGIDGDKNGDFIEEVTMEGTGSFRWPDIDGMNRLYNARYIKIEWGSGNILVSQKG